MSNLVNLKKSRPTTESTQFSITTDEQALVAITDEVRKSFPNCYLSITTVPRQIIINGVTEEKQCATLLGTGVHYSHVDKIKKCLIDAIKKHDINSSFVVTEPGQIEFDHGLNTLSLNILNLSRNEAHALALYKPEHKQITKARNEGLFLPAGLGYTANTGGVIEYVKGVEAENSKIISNLAENPKTCEQFTKQGYDFDNLQQGYNHNYLSDIKAVESRREEGVSGNITLAIGLDTVQNKGIQEDFFRFYTNLIRNPDVSPAKAAESLNTAVSVAMDARDHTNAIRPHIKKNTMSEARFAAAEEEMLTTVRNAYKVVQARGGEVDEEIKRNFFDTTPKITLEEAFVEASKDDHFGKLVAKPSAIVNPRIFIKNLKK